MPSNPMLIYVNQEYVEPGIKIETNVQSRLSLYGPTMDRNDIEFSSDGTNWNTPTASQVKMDPAREIRVYTGTTSNGIPLSNFKPGMLNTSSPISTQIRYRFVIFDSDTLTDKTLDLIRYVNVVEKPSITQGILDKLGTLSFLKNAWSSSTSWNVSADATAHDLSGNIKQFYPEPWFNPEKAGQPWQGPTTNTNRDISFNYYYDNEINTTKATVDPSGYILGCTKLVSDAKYKYARIDKRGCFGGQDISNLTQAEIDALPYNRITLDANKFINETQKPSTRGGYKGITCEVVHENRNWICASNCVFQGLTADAGNIAMSDISNAPNEVGWRTVPSSGIVKHNETQTFQCNITNQMYSVLNSERNERRKCMHGEMSAPLGGAAKSLQCSASKRVRGCQPITDTEDARCLNQIKQENGRFFKYCPVVCNPGGLSGNDLCTKDSQCKSHVYKHDINDSVANVPHTNPFESGDNKGYHRIEVDASGNNINKEAQRLSQKMFYSRLITDGDISGGKKEIDLNILEQSTLSGLFNHFKNNMKLKDMAAFFEGIKSYFNTNKMDDTNKWLNDSSNYGLAGSEDNLMMSSKESSDEMNYATGGRHLLSDDLVMNPTEYKNRNQYMAMARQELYNKKRDTDEKILNPTTIPAQDLEKLGKIMHQDKNLRKKLENKYLSEDEHYKVRMQISRLQGENVYD